LFTHHPVVLENVNPDLSDSEFLEREDEGLDAPTPGPMGSEAGDAPTPADEVGEEDEEDEEEDGDVDEELAAELELALGDDEGDEEEEEDDESEEEDEDDEDEEGGQARKLLNEEIRDLQAAVAKKDREIASSFNPLIRVYSSSS
jgi:transcription initiation factor TFIID subunit 7